MPLPRAPMPPAPLPELAMDVVTQFWVESSRPCFLPRLRHDSVLAFLSPIRMLPRPALACSILATPALRHGHPAGCTKPTVSHSGAIKATRASPSPSQCSSPPHPLTHPMPGSLRCPLAAARRSRARRHGHRASTVELAHGPFSLPFFSHTDPRLLPLLTRPCMSSRIAGRSRCSYSSGSTRGEDAVGRSCCG
jgi:hypothetical protein